MGRFGCPRCGDVIRVTDHMLACECGEIYTGADDSFQFAGTVAPVPLPHATDVLIFKLTYAGRADEAAVVQEHRP
jgi:hypothetical protein